MTEKKSDQTTPPPLPKRPGKSDQNTPPILPERPWRSDRNTLPPLPKRRRRRDQNTPPPVPERPSTSGENVRRNCRRDHNVRSRAAMREWLREHEVRPMKRVEQTSRRARCLKRSKPIIAVVLLLMLSGVIVMSIKLRKIRESTNTGGRNKGVIKKGTNINFI